MYHVVGTGLYAVILYLISYLFCRLGFFSYQFHKKLWNTILAISFLTTAAAGIFMALQTTYKWNIPFIKTILLWHVEFGIAMTFTGVFHFIWHLSYFRHFFSAERNTAVSNGNINLSSDGLRLNLFIIGFVSSSVQLLLLREMLNIAGGYELISGLYLASWLISSSAGASLAGRSGLSDIRKINLIFALSPLLSLALMFFLSAMFLHPGETPSFLISFIFTLLVLFPYCMVSGFTFIRITGLAGSCNNFSAGKSFSIETIGGVAAGIMISFLTAGIANTYEVLLLIILGAVSYAVLSYYLRSGFVRLIWKTGILVIAVTIIVLPADKLFRQILLHGIHVTETTDTPYGNITRGEYKGENSIYYDQRLLSYNYDVTEREENIHYAMLQCDNPGNVLLISGSLASQLPEILKYPVRKVTFIERDPELAKEWISTKDTLGGKLNITGSDAFRFIKKTREQFDAIILSVPPPSSLQLNRYYTTEFFAAAKKKLGRDGVIMCSPCPGNDYFNKESVLLLSSVFNSLKSVFRYVQPVAGNKVYFIASDKMISLNFCELTVKRHITNIYVCSDYLSDDLIEKKSRQLLELMDLSVRKNQTAFPVASLHFLDFSFTKTKNEKIPVIVLTIMIFAIPFIFIKRRNMLMYFSASALAGFEIAMLLTLQLIIGNMYQLTGLVIAAFMAGLAAGSGTRLKWIIGLSQNTKALILIAFYIFSGLSFKYLTGNLPEIPALLFILTCAFIPAVLTGQIFTSLTAASNDTAETSSVYSADLAGSALGFILISGVALPVLGVTTSVFILALMIFTGILFGTIRNK